MSQNIIRRQTPLNKAKEMLQSNGIETPYGWDIVLSMLLNDCDYLEIEGYGKQARFILHKEET